MNRAARIIAIGFVVATLAVSYSGFAANNGGAAFEQLKSLVGHWEAQPAGDMKATMDIELTSAGSAVLERFHMIQEGKPVEITTLYYVDSDQVKMTHYCEAGNQPTMRGTYAPESKTMTFDFISATNMKSPNDGHMHHAVYTFVDKDHLNTKWTFLKDQKEAFTEDVTYVRTK